MKLKVVAKRPTQSSPPTAPATIRIRITRTSGSMPTSASQERTSRAPKRCHKTRSSGDCGPSNNLLRQWRVSCDPDAAAKADAGRFGKRPGKMLGQDCKTRTTGTESFIRSDRAALREFLSGRCISDRLSYICRRQVGDQSTEMPRNGATLSGLACIGILGRCAADIRFDRDRQDETLRDKRPYLWYFWAISSSDG
jgi:hypothetical protein